METAAPSEKGAVALSEEETNTPVEPVVEDEPPLGDGAAGSGKCGAPGNEENVKWKFEQGTGDTLLLTIEGTGEMQNCGSYPPWYDYMDELGKPAKAVVGEGVTSIGDSAFENCSWLTEITLPKSVKSIGKRAFSGCRRLTKISLPEGITGIGENTFYNCSKLTEITLPNSVTSIGNNAFQNSGLTKIDLPESVTSIGNQAFLSCKSLTEINLPGVTDIGDSAFSGCSSLTEINLSGNVVSMGDGLFSDCSSLTKVTLPGSVASIGNSIFAGCKSLTKVTIPEGVTSIGNEVFWACNSLAELTLPATLTETGADIFRGCGNLKDINYGGSMSDWRKIKAIDLIGEDSTPVDTTIDKSWFLTEAAIHCNDGTIINARTWDRYSRERMKEIAELNKNRVVSIATADGVTYTFQQNDFNLTEDREEYKFGVTLHTEISGSGVDISVAAAEDFAVCIDYYYDGQLPGTAQISIPVDPKWNGKTLYYYQVKGSRTLEDMGVNAVVADGVCKVSQNFCAKKYVLLAKSPEELGVPGYTDGSKKPAGDSGTDKISGDRMKELAKRSETEDVEIKTADGLTYTFKKGDVEIRTANGLSYTFQKGDFNPAGDQAYDFNATLSRDFAGSGIQNSAVKEEDFAGRINFAHSGPLPGTAQISIPVDPKWNGKTLYYYQIMANGSLKDTGESAVVADGTCKVKQNHCSDYVLLAKSPDELGVPRYIPVGNGGTEQPQQPITLARTGDATNIVVYAVLMILAAGGGAVALARVRRKRHDA